MGLTSGLPHMTPKDLTDRLINHNEAWSLAHHKIAESNLARCYIELRAIGSRVADNAHTIQDLARLHEIVHSNDI